MTPFQQFRLWTRHAPVWERGLAAVVSLAVLAGLVWIAQPLAASSGPSNASGGVLSYQALDGNGAAASNVPIPQTQPATCPKGVDQGATADAVTVAVAVVSLGGAAGNATFGLPSPKLQRQAYGAVASSINAHGGAGCRQVHLTFYDVNTSNADSVHQACLDVLQHRPFAVVGIGFDTAAECITQAKVPFISPTVWLDDQARYYPYLFGTSTEMGVHETVLALRKLGYFDPANGFAKLGIIYSTCYKPAAQRFKDDVAALKLDAVSFDVGGTCGPATSSALQQAVLKFKRAGVTNVIPFQLTSSFANLTNIAQSQKFRPRWGMTPDGTVQITYGLLGPNFASMKGAVAIETTAFGEEHSGTTPAPGTAACNSIMNSAGLATVYRQLQGIGGIACSQLWELQSMLNNAPKVARNMLAEGLRKAAALPWSYPNAPGAYAAPRVTVNGGYWRALDFDSTCNCWKLASDKWNPGLK